MMEENGKKKEKAGNFKEFFKLIPRLRIPWILLFMSLGINLVYNDILYKIPTTTTRLMSGELTGGALWDAIWFFVLYAALSCIQMMFFEFARCSAVYRARGVLWERMLHIRMDYYNTNNPSDLMSALTNDITAGMLTFFNLGVTLLPDLYYIFKVMGTLGEYDILLVVSLFVLIPLKVLYMVYIGRWNYRTQAGVYKEIGGLTGYLAERIRRLTLIKTYTNEENELENGKGATQKLFHANMRVTKLSCATTAINTFLTLLQNGITVILGVTLLQKGRIDVRQWIAFFLYTSTFSGKVNAIIGDWISVKSMQGSFERCCKIMGAPKEEVKEGQQDDPDRKAEIVFENVSFSYGEKKALKNVSFTVKAGTSTAIVGLCGSGKTTSLSLIENFYAPSEGTVRVCGVPAGERERVHHRTGFSYLQQGSSVFGGSLREALTYGIREELPDEKIMEAARRSGFDAYIEAQDEGLDAPVAAEGLNMSGGQRQRLVFTRELLRNADMVLMDEPTSALDAATAAAVKEAIFSIFAGKTMIIVSHDLNLIRDMDQIVVLKEGCLEGCGTFEQLENSCELFREMVAVTKNPEKGAAS